MKVKLIASKDEIEKAIKNPDVRHKTRRIFCVIRVLSPFIKIFIFYEGICLCLYPVLGGGDNIISYILLSAVFSCLVTVFAVMWTYPIIPKLKIEKKLEVLSSLNSISAIVNLFNEYLSNSDQTQLRKYLLNKLDFEKIMHDKGLETEIRLAIFRAFYKYFESLPDRSYINIKDLLFIVDELVKQFKPRIQESYERYYLARQCATKQALKVVKVRD